MALTLTLPTAGGALAPYTLRGRVPLKPPAGVHFNRIAYSAAHVVADPLASNDPWLTPAIDWDTTLKFRHRLWDLGLGVAEAMDTAQRGMGLAAAMPVYWSPVKIYFAILVILSLIGWTGLALLVLLLSGLWAWWPRGSWTKALRFKRHAHPQRALRDWHKLAGLSGFGFQRFGRGCRRRGERRGSSG